MDQGLNGSRVQRLNGKGCPWLKGSNRPKGKLVQEIKWSKFSNRPKVELGQEFKWLKFSNVLWFVFSNGLKV